MLKFLRVVNGVFGVGLIAFGVSRFFWSMASVSGAGAVNATVDSESRAGGPLLVAFGVGYLWVARQDRAPVALSRFLAMTMLFLALARVVSIVAEGMPNWFIVAAMPVEFAGAASMWAYAEIDGRAGGDSAVSGLRADGTGR